MFDSLVSTLPYKAGNNLGRCHDNGKIYNVRDICYRDIPLTAMDFLTLAVYRIHITIVWRIFIECPADG